MKPITKIAIFLVVVLCSLAYMGYYFFLINQADWAFIESVGGIKVGTPLKTEQGYYLPIQCNVSGLDSITSQPTALNSALWCLSTQTFVEDSSIYLHINYGISFSDYTECNCSATNIGKLKSGNYKVYYQDETTQNTLIGAFTIE